MARITEKDVHQAAAELDAQGIKPTTSKVREKLGSGSFSTIQTHLATYEGSGSVDELPETPPELAAILPAIWEKAWAIAAEKFDIERLKWVQVETDLRLEVQTLEKIIEEQDARLEETEGKHQTAIDEVSRLSKAVDDLKEKNAYLKGKAEGRAEAVKKPTKPKPMKQVEIKEITGE